MNTGARQRTASRLAIWFGLFGGAISWTAHLVFASIVAEFGCASGLGERDYLGISLVAWLELALTAVTTLAAAAATIVAYRIDRRFRSDQDLEWSAEHHAAFTGVLTSGLFTLIILFESIPIVYYLQSC